MEVCCIFQSVLYPKFHCNYACALAAAIEEEITCGIFSLKQNPNQCCFWFKRVFTDLLDQKPSDSSLATYADMTLGKRGMEFDTENLKILNILKEARLPAKYIGYKREFETVELFIV